MEEVQRIGKILTDQAEEAQKVLDQCQSAYSAATSQGLAAAFSDRSVTLSRSMWVWVGGLVLALAAGSYLGSKQLANLTALIAIKDAAPFLVSVDLVLAVLSVAAPVWFAWLSTKQIGQRFRLAEDYAFKASVSRAYEGYRREAARYDEGMASRLLNSALDRLDELPLRLIEAETHGSPWHELASSENVREALKVIPGFADQISGLAGGALDAAKNRVAAAAAAIVKE